MFEIELAWWGTPEAEGLPHTILVDAVPTKDMEIRLMTVKHGPLLRMEREYFQVQVIKVYLDAEKPTDTVYVAEVILA